MLLSKYTAVVNEHNKVKQALDETKSVLEMTRTTFQRQTEQMESEELANQKRLGIWIEESPTTGRDLVNHLNFKATR